jgi:hypothetical protein
LRQSWDPGQAGRRQRAHDSQRSSARMMNGKT